jgi:hypothetical protein
MAIERERRASSRSDIAVVYVGSGAALCLESAAAGEHVTVRLAFDFEAGRGAFDYTHYEIMNTPSQPYQTPQPEIK